MVNRIRNPNSVKGFLVIAFMLLLAECNSPKQKERPLNGGFSKTSTDSVVSLLIKADLFNITDSAYIDSAKACLLHLYKHDYFGGFTYPDSLRYVDFRFYIVDSEELFEVGGLTKYLDLVKPTFDKLGIKLKHSNEKSIERNNFWKHTIELNSQEYIAFEGMLSEHDLWDKAYICFIQMLNDQLKKHKSDEQFYPISSANNGMMVMLTPKQFEIVKKWYPNDDNHPKTIDEWKKSAGYK